MYFHVCENNNYASASQHVNDFGVSVRVNSVISHGMYTSGNTSDISVTKAEGFYSTAYPLYTGNPLNGYFDTQ